MEVIRVNRAEGTLREVLHGERQKVVDEITKALNDTAARGGYYLPSPIRSWAGGKIAGLWIGDTELLHRYSRMSAEGRRVLVRSICSKMHAHGVRDMDIEIPWGSSVVRTLKSYLREDPEADDEEILSLNVAKVTR